MARTLAHAGRVTAADFSLYRGSFLSDVPSLAGEQALFVHGSQLSGRSLPANARPITRAGINLEGIGTTYE
jgi:hypothetical protein